MTFEQRVSIYCERHNYKLLSIGDGYVFMKDEQDKVFPCAEDKLHLIMLSEGIDC